MQSDKINEVLNRSVEAVYPSKDRLKSVLESGKMLKLYTGIDPTGKLHIGHMVWLKKLKQFQDLGHEVIVLIGDFTARIGDPTDKTATRKKLSKEEVEQNSLNYKRLVGKILNTDKANVKFLHNEEWTNKLKPADMLDLASSFTVQQLIERDMFQERIKAGKEIYLHEFLYPIFQAYDSVSMDVDLEIGGNDQTFNMLAGRNLMKKLKNKEKFVLTTKLLTDPSGKKMGKTEGNMIHLEDEPEEIFGKVMAFPDELISVGFELLTDRPMEEIKKISEGFKSGSNPKDAKEQLAFDIVSQLHSEDQAKKAKDNFDSVFGRGELPANIDQFEMEGAMKIADLIFTSGLSDSRSQAKRLVEQGAVKVNGEVVRDIEALIEPGSEHILKVGKLKFLKVK